jgi:N-acetylglucosaminyl-diphospho-decaprenol L-rhamnosyltransferase
VSDVVSLLARRVPLTLPKRGTLPYWLAKCVDPPAPTGVAPAKSANYGSCVRKDAIADVVIVSYNSRDELENCVQPFVRMPTVSVIVVDNASPDHSLEVLSELPVTAIQLDDNGGFARGCNVGWRAGSAPYVLFLNPDAVMTTESLLGLVNAMDREPCIGITSPRIVAADGSLDFSQRRFPRLRSTYAHALFLNRVFPRALWASEMVRDLGAYAHPSSPEWVSGACMLVRRTVLEELGGWDEGFFMYCEDKDLCRRVRDAGYDIRYEPASIVRHDGGGSAPRAALMPVLAASRIRYAKKHRGPLAARVERLGIGLTALTHMMIARGGQSVRSGHAASLRTAARWSAKSV